MGSLSYLAVLIGCLAVTAPLEWGIGARVYRRPGRLALTLVLSMTPFVVWDIVAILRDHWSFSDERTIGVSLGGLMPLEELLFFVVIPICALLTHQAVLRLGARRWPDGRLARELAALQPDAGGR